MLKSVRAALLCLTASTLAIGAGGAAHAGSGKPKRIEVAFVLDTTGSMVELIDGAKRKIWSIANSIVDINPDADIRMALIGYRDVGDDYVVKTYDMSADIQGLYGHLMRFRADGGGDTPESVNEALDAAVRDLDWSTRDDVRRIVFLVGDAPPHMDYANGPKYKTTIRRAREAGILVNTVQAGSDPETQMYWQEMARLGEGRYFAIPQDGGQVEAVSSPFDERIIRLQGKIDGTIILYGTEEKQIETRDKMELKAAAPAAVQVDNSKYYSKRTFAKEIVTGGGDLLDDVRNNVRGVGEIAAEELPPELRGKNKAELEAFVAGRTAEREKLEAEMAELVRQRDAYVEAERKKQPEHKSADSFDQRVIESLTAQF